jgi:hypothetical protein
MVGVDVLGELRLVESLQVVIEPGHGPTLALQPGPDSALIQPPQYGGGLGEQREVAYLVTVVAQPADDLREMWMSTNVMGTMTGPSYLREAVSSISYTPCRQAARSWKSPRRAGGSMRSSPKPRCSGSHTTLPGSRRWSSWAVAVFPRRTGH